VADPLNAATSTPWATVYKYEAFDCEGKLHLTDCQSCILGRKVVATIVPTEIRC